MKTNENNIELYAHCRKCLEEWKADEKINTKQNPKDYSKVQFGWTKQGIQVWCNRHECNIIHIDFEGQKHPADTTAKSSQRIKDGVKKLRRLR